MLAGAAALGSYTTFSTWMFETQRLAEDALAGGDLTRASASASGRRRRAPRWPGGGRGPPVNEDCLKLTSYFGERHRTRAVLADELVDLYGRHASPSASSCAAWRASASCTICTRTAAELSEDLPVVSVALDSPERIEGLLAQVPRSNSAA